ncbi:RHS repeat-associated core domain-containing protein [Flavobacterium supellecticarium]|uniref:RHS repeat-associated core domain-containing protein n=1 Tax=Flavobacterium supellecticarium TaxID=2565924 RepID=UPI001E351F07|nr:RHS repeat-associated core domain-containing protein [Flavobacterium supellecticarium]
MEESHYYPFGLKHKMYNVQQFVFVTPPDGSPEYMAPVLMEGGSKPLINPYKYKYNGKELQDELGLNVYDYGARNYDAAIGRWMNIDPLAELSRRYSPYTYALDNPVFFIDVDGMYASNTKDRDDRPTYGSGHWSDSMRNQNSTGDNSSENSSNAGNGDPKKGKKSFGDTFRQMASQISNWVDENIGNSAREMTDVTSEWATDISETHASIGSGDIFQRHMGPAKELYELGFGATGVGLASTRSFVTKVVPEGYTIAASKFDYFFGRVTSSANNIRRSQDNLRDLTTLGVKNERDLIKLFNKAFESATIKTTVNDYGTTLTKTARVGNQGQINVGFFYKGGDMKKEPIISTVIPKIYK